MSEFKKNVISADVPVFSARGNGKVHIEFDENLFSGDSVRYNHSLARLCAQFTIIGYDMPVDGAKKGTGILYALEKVGMNGAEIYSQSLEDEENYFFANKKITVSGSEFTLVFAAFLGSRLGQWYTNFDAGTLDTHKGFEKCKNFLYEKLRSYITSLNIQKENTKILLTGHSRGGAIANLLGAFLIDGEQFAFKENIYTFTFASPSVTMKSEKNDEKYKRIFNIVNDEDFVTKCMIPQWGYGRYGVTLSLPDKDNTDDYDFILKEMNKHYTEYMSGEVFIPFKKGTKTVDKLFSKFSASIKNIDEYYEKQFNSPNGKTSMYSYFISTLCTVTGEPEGSEKKAAAVKLLLKTSFIRHKSSKAIKAIADFFVFYEGLAGATNGKISKTYFSYGHNIHTYCAYLMAVNEEKLFKINGIK